MNSRLTVSITITILLLLCLSVFLPTLEAKSIDPYKVLGVDKKASQREIQKAFHKLSLQYHPDKNKNKGAQEKFAEINNAYEILSDEEKRKNFDLYGDATGNAGFSSGYPGDQGGYTYYSSGGQGQNGFNFRPNAWQNMGGQGGGKSFSFSFGGSGSQNSFGFGLNDIFSNLFGDNVGGSGFGGSSGSQSGSRSSSGSSSKSIKPINSKTFKNEVADKGMTWLLLSHNPSTKGSHYHESIIQEVADSLQGALKVGSINCQTEKSLCNELGIHPRQVPRIFVYSYKASNKASLVEYNDDLVAKQLKTFCRDHLPRFSSRIGLKDLESFSSSKEKLPRVLLLSTKKDTPVIWRVLSGLYRKRFIFNDAEVYDVTDPMAKKLGVDALPAIVGWLSNGDRHVLKAGISVQDLQSAVRDLSAVLDGFDKKNKKAASSQGRKQDDSDEKRVPLLTEDNFDDLCGENKPVCIIGAFRSSKAKEKLESVLTTVSQKPLSRQWNVMGSKDSVSYTLLDAKKQQAFLNALDKSGYKSGEKLLVAYKPRRGKFATYAGEMTTEKVEGFISSVLNGDLEFTKIRQKPVVK